MGLAVLFNNLQNQVSGGGFPFGASDIRTGGASVNVSKYREIIRPRIPEGTTHTITLIFSDDDGESLTLESMSEILLTLYQMTSGEIINGRSGQNILNENNGTLSSFGDPGKLRMDFELQPPDSAVLGEDPVEWHVARFDWKWNGGAKRDRYQVLMAVKKI